MFINQLTQYIAFLMLNNHTYKFYRKKAYLEKTFRNFYVDMSKKENTHILLDTPKLSNIECIKN